MSTNPKTSDRASALPIAAGCETKVKPEWLRVPAAVGYSGIGRSSLYELIAGNQIRSAVIRKPGNVRGIRIVSLSSLEAFLNKMADSNAMQHQELATT